MIIPNPVIKLDYNPVKDILFVEWPDLQKHSVSQAAHTLDVIVETVKYYHVKYLVTDTRKGIIDIPEHQYKEVIFKFAKALTDTRLQKLARVVKNKSLEEEPINEVRQETMLAIPVQNYETLEEALDWLMSTTA